MINRLKMVKDKNVSPLRLKITKKKSGTYTIESISIKQLRAINEMQNKRRWWISKDGMNIYLDAEK